MDDCTHCASVCCAMYSCVVTVVCSVVVFLVLLGLSDLLDCQAWALHGTARPWQLTSGMIARLEAFPGDCDPPKNRYAQWCTEREGVWGGSTPPPPPPPFSKICR